MILYDTREENQVVISIPILKSPVRGGGVRRGGGGRGRLSIKSSPWRVDIFPHGGVDRERK